MVSGYRSCPGRGLPDNRDIEEVCNRTRGGAVMLGVWWRCGGYLRERLLQKTAGLPIKFARVHVALVVLRLQQYVGDPRPRILIGARSARALHHHASSGQPAS